MTSAFWWTFVGACLAGGATTAWWMQPKVLALSERLRRRGESVLRSGHAIVHARRDLIRQASREEALALACRQLVDAGFVQGAFVGLFERDGLRIVGHAGRLLGLAGLVEPLPAAIIERLRLPTASPAPLTTDDDAALDWRDDAVRMSLLTASPRHGANPLALDESADLPPWLRAARQAGLRGQFAVPIRLTGTRAVLGVYADRPQAFDDALTGVMRSFGLDIAEAIEWIDRNDRLRVAVETAQGRGAQWHVLFDALAIPIAIVALPKGEILFVNRATCQYSGLASEQMIGRTMRSLGIGLLEAERQRAWTAYERDGRVRNLEVMHRDREGGLAPLLLSLEPIVYDGHPATLVMCLEIAPLRAAQAQANDRAIAEAANHAKTAFLTRLGQQIRAPLYATVGFTQLLRDEARERLDARDLVHLAHIRQAGWHLLALTNDILDMSSIETGRMPVTLVPTALRPELEFAITLSEPLAAAAGIQLHADFRGQPPCVVEADGLRLRQVLLNLISNAIKYNRRGGAVWLRTRLEASVAWIDVIDDGIGMDEAQQKGLFEPFNRLGRDGQGRQGLGIGLVVSRELVRLMGGRVEVESAPARGTSFRISLRRSTDALPEAVAVRPDAEPLFARGDVDAMPARSIAEALADRPFALDDVRGVGDVLYVGDDADCLAWLAHLLADLRGVRLRHAPDADQAVSLCAQTLPDVVLLDLPEDEPELADWLRMLSGGRAFGRTRVILLDTAGETRLHGSRRAVPVIDGLERWPKPVDARRLRACLGAPTV